jgi:integrase
MLYQLITFCRTYMYMYLLYTYVYLTMYCSLPRSPYCPVMSFQNYVRRLHPSNERLWQRPLDSFSENSPVWYCNSGVGEKTLSRFMSRLSKSCGLSLIYTNHSMRATGATILSKNMHGTAQIMAVTGHKSVQSLTTYQRVDTEDKIKMGQTLTQNVTFHRKTS